MTTRSTRPGFRAWAAAATVSQVGDAILYFGLGWAAAGYGGTAAGLVLTAITLSRTLLMLLGGAVTDRLGPRAVMLAADTILLAGSVAAAIAVAAVGTPWWLLMAIALMLGIVTSFHHPAVGAFPALVVEPPALPRALALRHAGFQAASLTGGPVGGLLVAAGGLGVALGVNAVSYLAVLAVVLVLRPVGAGAGVGRRSGVASGSLIGEVGDGLRVVARIPALRTVLLLYAVAAGLVFPLSALLVPLLARERGWGAVGAGLVVGAQGVGALLGALVLARTGAHPRTGRAVGSGLLGAAVGTAGLALAPTVGIGVASGLVTGVGLAVFIAHLSPLVVTAAPDTHRARIQSLLGVVQSATLVVTNLLLGTLATAGAGLAAGITAAGLAGAAALAGTAPALRAAGGGGGRESNPPGRDARPRRC